MLDEDGNNCVPLKVVNIMLSSLAWDPEVLPRGWGSFHGDTHLFVRQM